MMSFAPNYLEEVKQVVAGFDPKVIEDAVALLDLAAVKPRE